MDRMGPIATGPPSPARPSTPVTNTGMNNYADRMRSPAVKPPSGAKLVVGGGLGMPTYFGQVPASSPKKSAPMESPSAVKPALRVNSSIDNISRPLGTSASAASTGMTSPPPVRKQSADGSKDRMLASWMAWKSVSPPKKSESMETPNAVRPAPSASSNMDSMKKPTGMGAPSANTGATGFADQLTSPPVKKAGTGKLVAPGGLGMPSYFDQMSPSPPRKTEPIKKYEPSTGSSTGYLDGAGTATPSAGMSAPAASSGVTSFADQVASPLVKKQSAAKPATSGGLGMPSYFGPTSTSPRKKSDSVESSSRVKPAPSARSSTDRMSAPTGTGAPAASTGMASFVDQIASPPVKEQTAAKPVETPVSNQVASSPPKTSEPIKATEQSTGSSTGILDSAGTAMPKVETSPSEEEDDIPPQFPIFGAKYMARLERAARSNPLPLRDELEKRRVIDDEDDEGS